MVFNTTTVGELQTLKEFDECLESDILGAKQTISSTAFQQNVMQQSVIHKITIVRSFKGQDNFYHLCSVTT